MSASDLPAVPQVPGPGLPVAAAREAAVKRLTEAYADGHLTHDELDHRLTIALGATSEELVAASCAGLPDVPVDHDVEITAMSGTIQRDGRWRVPRRLRISTEYGAVRLDLTQAVFTSHEVEIELQLPYGSARIVVPPDATVDLDGLRADWNQPRYDARRRIPGAGPLIRVTGRMEYGRLTVKHRNRS